jgi:hypothetical protein
VPAGYRAYGATELDYVTFIDSNGDLAVSPGAVVTIWTTQTGSTQVTNLLDSDGITAITSVTAGSDGSIPRFYAPSTLTSAPWGDPGGGRPRRQFIPADLLENESGGTFTGSIDPSQITGITSIGTSLVTAANQAAARTAIGAASTTGVVTCVNPVRIYGIGTTLPAVDGSEVDNDLFILRPV